MYRYILPTRLVENNKRDKKIQISIDKLQQCYTMKLRQNTMKYIKNVEKGGEMMINIKIPKYDLSVSKDKLDQIPKKSGVYFLFNKENELIYIGIAKDLNMRLYFHFHGKTHTFLFIHIFHTCSMFFENDQTNRSIYELYLINDLKPPLNVKGNTEFKQIYCRKNSVYADGFKCRSIKNDGEPCKRAAHTNGYCSFHGGNGITKQVMVDKAVREFEGTLLALEGVDNT